jgi:hypothetical protein
MKITNCDIGNKSLNELLIKSVIDLRRGFYSTLATKYRS